jgi:hypothetical protein
METAQRRSPAIGTRMRARTYSGKRVIGGEGNVALEAEGARRPAQRPLGHEMDRVGRVEFQHVVEPRGNIDRRISG